MKLLLTSLILITLSVIADQGSKIWVRINVNPYESSTLLPNLLELTHVQNKGVSFSFLGNIADSMRVPLLIVISLLAMGLLTYYWWRQRHQLNALSHLAFQLILGGAIGNLIDRTLFGAVTDFLHFRFYSISFFVNNLADILISAGVVIYLLGMLQASNRQRES
ncbi:MAG: signal peptidase II [SAR324 cluster bacterium]|nr:signal peptidase II [SAR324 cluster bacterium]MCZ6556896.1 signal peptidase II [SAR324 cluster bacterium]MCZ6728638.1 signal peptidase II [SAR324 cluster bacterium]MCZ6841936.1 signal peptidase II [SAR324 cluster bacterium]